MEEPVPLPSDDNYAFHLSFNKTPCPHCWSAPSDHELRNYDEVWRDGDVYCTKCGTYVRMYDAG